MAYNQENSDSDSSSSELETPSRPTPSKTFLSEHEMLEQRNASKEHSFSEIKSRTSPQESKYIFENLSILRNDIQNSCSDNLKRDFTSQESTSTVSRIANENLSPTKKGSFSHTLFEEDSTQTKQASRPPLMPIDMNSIISDAASSLVKKNECAKTGTVVPEGKNKSEALE
jgi:hypothetical protein